MLVGREEEQRSLVELVAVARHGTAGSLVLRGEPGVGKSTLLEAAVRSVQDDGATLLLRAQGLQAEAPLAFAALHRVLRPLMRLRDELPAPQARAMRLAFGEEDGPGVEPFLVGIATLSLLTAAAEEQLVVVVVDDAHWLDQASSDALLFCARRLGADRVAMVFAAREPAEPRFDAEGLDEIVVTGLGPDDARALLARHTGGVPATDVTERLLDATGGNPLALVELSAELSADQRSGAAPLPQRLPLTEQLERTFLERSRRLPPDVQDYLLLVAADQTGALPVLRDAASDVGLGEESAAQARASGLISLDDGTVTLRHPLVRSAIYQAADDSARRRTHAALAEAYKRSGEPDREAWQRAAAAPGPDAGVADALQGVAERAQRRGAHAAAMTAYERAASMTGDAEQRAALCLAAARSAWAAGRAGQAQELLSRAQAATDPVVRGDAARLRGHIEVNLGSATTAHGVFIDAVHALHTIDPHRALQTAVLAAVMRTYGADSGARLADGEVPCQVDQDDSPLTACLKHLLTAMTLTAEGDLAAAVTALDRAFVAGEHVEDREMLWNLGNAALQLGADDAQQHFYDLALSRAREAGAVTAVVYALERLCFSHYLAGDLGAARRAADEALSLASSVGQPALTAPPTAWLTMLSALQGRADYDDLLGRLEHVVATHQLGILAGPVHDVTRWARAARAASQGDTALALHQLGQFRVAPLRRMAFVERLDAAVRVGDSEQARAWVDELAAFAEVTGRPWALAAVAYGRAVTATTAGTGEDDVDRHFQEALSVFAQAGRPLDAARVELAYGEWLRRGGHRVDARTHLRRALDTFQDVHAEHLADRATQELRASGETARKRDVSTLVQLTPMELKVAQLVATGLSNKDVAAQCWVSPRTVAFHLRNVFTKAGITSRGELAQLELA